MRADLYRDAGVDIDACDAWLARLRDRVPAIGGFAGLFALPPEVATMREPTLVAGTDGVGTKLLVARAAGDLSTVGIDCVAMVVNDLVCTGARPLFFLDYLAVGRFDPADADAILDGLRAGCDAAGCALVGGETAELPGLLAPGDFDVAGFGVALLDRADVVDGHAIAPGDVVVGLASSGLHSNGYSLARRLFPEFATDRAVARRLLEPTHIYVRPLLAAREALRKLGADLRGIAHVTGGGLPGNLVRILPPGTCATLDAASWPRPRLFDELRLRGGLPADDLARTFNLGIGMTVVVAPDARDAFLEAWRAACDGAIHAWPIGTIAADPDARAAGDVARVTLDGLAE